MGTLQNLRRRAGASRGSSFIQTQPGDPEFSLSTTPDSQAQYPAAAAEYRFYQNQRNATNRLAEAQQLGFDTSGPDFDSINQAANGGFLERALTLGENLIGWIDGPRQAVNLLIQDIAGGVAEDGQRDPGFGDYWDALWGGIEDEEGFELATGLNPRSGSHTIDMFGWEEEDELLPRIGRGIADFGFQLLTDPLTYLTGGLSGLGRMTATAAGKKLQREAIDSIIPLFKKGMSGREIASQLPEGSYFRKIAASLEDDIGHLQSRFKSKMDDFGGQFPPEMERSLSRWLGDTGPNGENVWANIAELAVANRVADDVIKPLAGRRLADVAAEALEELPAYARGGLRISIPFTKRSLSSGVMVPGTRGLGRKILGDPVRSLSQKLRKFGPYQKLADNLDSALDSFDLQRPLMKALGKDPAEGGIEGWQYFIASSGLDKLHNSSVRRVITAQLNSKMGRINQLAEQAGIDDVSIIHAHMMDKLENANVGGDLVNDILGHMGVERKNIGEFMPNAELDNAVEDLTRYVKETFDDYHDKLAALDPSVKARFIDGYIPHIKKAEGSSILDQFAEAGAGVSKRAIQKAQREGSPGLAFLAEMINAQAAGGVLESRLGATRYFSSMPQGRLAALTIADGGALMMDEDYLSGITRQAIDNGVIDESFLQTRFLPVSQMNEILEPAVRQLADEFNIQLPSNWDGKIFNDNPLEVLTGYMASLEEAIHTWDIVNSLKTAGLAFRKSTAVDVQDTLQSLMTQIVRHGERIKTDVPVNHSFPDDDSVPLSYINEIVDEADMSERMIQRSPGVVIRIGDSGEQRVVDGWDTIREARKNGDSTVPAVYLEGGPMDTTIPRNPEHNVGKFMKNAPTESTLAEQAGVPLAPFEQDLLRRAIGRWEGSSTRLREIIREITENPQRKVPKDMADDTRLALAFMRAHSSEAKPWREWIGNLPGRHADELENVGPNARAVRISRLNDNMFPNAKPQQGEKFTIHMESAAIVREGELTGGQFQAHLDEIQRRAPGTETWKYEIDPDAPLLINPNTGEAEVFVSGNFRVSEIDDINKVARLEYIDPVLPAVKKPSVVGQSGVVEPKLAKEVFHTPPWSASPVQDNLILKGFDKNTTTAIPARVLGALNTAGMPANKNTIHKNKELFEIAKMSEEDFMSMRPFKDAPEYVPEITDERAIVNMSVDTGADGVQGIRVAINEDRLEMLGNDGFELAVAVDNAARRLNRIMRKNGGWTPENVRALMQSSNTNNRGAELVYETLRRKLASMPDDVVEFFSGEAAEVFNTRALYDEWERLTNDLLKKYAVPQTLGGQLAVQPERLRKVADDEVLREIQAIKTAARKAGDAGYDEVAKIMRNVEVFTEMANHPGFINPGKYSLQGPAVDDLQMHTLMARFLRNFAKNSATMYTPQGIAAAKAATNTALRNWRAMATIARPSFHIRNLVGGSWMNMLMGVSSASYAKVAKNAVAFRKGLQEAVDVGDDVLEHALKQVDEGMRPVFRAAWEEDVMSGFVSTEFRRLTPTDKQTRLDWLKVWDSDKGVLQRLGGKTMEGIEDLLRMSLFTEYFDPANPATAKVAREFVNAVHYDYVNLTPFETKMKSFIPFFVWTRRNLPRQLEMAVENPRTVQRYRAMMQAMNDNFGGENQSLPEGDHFSAYAAGTDYYVNEGTPFWARVMIDPDLPVRDLLELPMPTGPAALEWANNLLGPHVSTLVDINSQREWGDVNAPAQFVPILKGLAAVGLYDETLTGDVRIPYWSRTVAETAIPFTREVIDPMTGGPTDPNRQQRLGISQDDGVLESVLKNIAGIGLGGAGMKFTTPADARGAAARSDGEIDDIIKAMRLQGKLPPSQG